MPEIQELLQLKDLWDEQSARSLGNSSQSDSPHNRFPAELGKQTHP